MTYNEILSAAKSLSEIERQSLVQALSVGNQCEAAVRQARACHPCWKSRVAALIAAEPVTTVSAKTTVHNASSARIAAGLSPNIPAHGSRSSTRRGL